MTQDIFNKIKAYIHKFEWECNSKEMSNQGTSEQLYNFREATHKDFKDIIFVVYNKDIYKGLVLSSQKFGAIAFKNTGEAIADFNIEKKCGVNFYDELTFGKKIL